MEADDGCECVLHRSWGLCLMPSLYLARRQMLGAASQSAALMGATGAVRLLRSETDGIAIDFTDLSMQIKDTTTPANNFAGDPNNKLTYASPSTKWILNRSGVYEGGTTLRTEYDTSGNPLGVRVEEARTNLVLRSTEFDNVTNWILGTNTITANQITSPVGDVTSDLFTATATGTSAYVRQTCTVSATTVYTASLYVKKGSAGFFVISPYDGTDGNRYWFNLTTGAVASTALIGAGFTNTSASMVTLPNNWFRLSVTFTTKTLTTFNLFAGPTDADASLTLSSGQTCYLWQAQLELGSFATSPIVTAGSTVTRAADQLSLLTALFPYNAAQGTVFAECTPGAPDTLTRIIVAMGFNARFAYNSTNLYAYDGANGLSYGSATVGSKTRMAVAFGSGTQSLAKDGSISRSDSVFDGDYTAAASLGIGGIAGANVLSGIIHRIAYFTSKASDAVLPTIGA